MYLKKKEAEKIIDQLNSNIKQEYQEKLDFLTKLLQDDDWSFIIKSHSLLESLATELIINKLDQKLKVIVQRLPLHGEISKIKICSTYDLIPKDQIKVLQKLSEIRNNIVHKYENINFNLNDYVLGLDNNALRNWKSMFILEEMNDSMKNIIIENQIKIPKIALWLTICHIVNQAISKIKTLETSNVVQEESLKIIEELLKEIKICE